MATRRSTVFENVDPGLARAIEAVTRDYKPYRAEAFSGNRPRPKNPSSLHPQGRAIDVNLYDWKTGEMLPNIGAASSAGAYQGLANEIFKWAQANDPELAKELYWGGYFQGGDWPQDYMHFQRGGTAPAGGSWETGFNPGVMKKLGLTNAGGLGEVASQMQAAGYTPQQIRNALASIESAGSGDYKALGVWTGDPEEGRDRAYGRYQVMGKNIGPWAEQYLKKAGVTPEQFLADPALQDQLTDAVMGDYVKQYGLRGAFSKWYTGSPDEPNRTDPLGKLTGKTYVDKAMAALGGMKDSPSESGGARFGGGGLGTPPVSPYSLVAGKDKKDTMLEAMAKAGMSGMGQAANNWKLPQIEPTPGAARVDAPVAPLLDPQQTEYNRQRLAQLLAQLNNTQGQGAV